MVPLGAVANVNESAGPVQITRYNMFPAAAISGASLPGVSTGDVLSTMERLADQELPQSMTYEWTELSYLQKLSSRIESFRDLQQNPYSAFALGVVLVFFVLAGLYESWSLPVAVILVVPLCLSSALLGIGLAGMDVNIFVQVGFVVLVGLAAKNAILIVEFARDRQQEGATRVRGGCGSRASAAAADYHDVAGVHSRRIPAGDRAWSRRGNASHARHGRVLRHDRRHAVRHFPDAGVLLRHPQPGKSQSRCALESCESGKAEYG